MPTDPARPAPAQQSDPDATAVLPAGAFDPAEGGYGDRYAEDSFDYPVHPSPGPAQSWSQGGPPPDFTPTAGPAAESDGADVGQRRADQDRSRPAGRGQQVAARRRPALMAAAALVAMGGFGAALSMVSDTLSSDAVPSGSGGTAQVSAPKPPIEPSPAPDATASASPPAAGGAGGAGTSAAPSPTGLLPSAREQHGDEHGEGGREEHDREDGDRADDD
ncbi:hypothetical protein EAO75_16375 [Streptomyces sp. uw30]|uniref:hypothetical protein n=1 Tax=Streptomyces sp. uw30 TaxID=1828179 RepID=UPI0011CE213C|nr:hypothetical protein [Streptomyces sp. uw30]TXS48515.1 hypothetical protein EAO75_16375 [Streptomyces sp. uw30]